MRLKKRRCQGLNGHSCMDGNGTCGGSLLVTNRETCRGRVPTPCPRLHPSNWDSTSAEEYEGRAAGEARSSGLMHESVGFLMFLAGFAAWARRYFEVLHPSWLIIVPPAGYFGACAA